MPAIRYNIISFLLVVGALAGNASIADIDIFLILCVPIGIILFLQDVAGRRKGPSLLLVFAALLPFVFFYYRADEVGIPYFGLYYLWPIKTALLAIFLLRQKGDCWPPLNDYMLAALVIVLILSGSIEEGRFVSLFGPNMLYRFFGTLFLLALIRAGSTTGLSRTIAVSMSGLGLFGMSLTGSVGTVPLILCSIYFARHSLWQIMKGHGGPIFFFGFLALLYQARGFLSSNLVSRVSYKIDNIDGDERLFAWERLMSRDPDWWGLNYSDFPSVWTTRVPYPHNILVELWAFYGYIGFGIGMLTFAAYLTARNTRYYFYFPSVVILIGAMLSGDLSDNYAALSLFTVAVVHYRKMILGKTGTEPSSHKFLTVSKRPSYAGRAI